MELYIFDMAFNRLGIIDTYTTAEFELKYHNHSEMNLILDASKDYVDLLLADELRIITKSTDINRGYIIEVAEYRDDKNLEITVIAKSLSIMTSWRIVEGQQRFTGSVENVLMEFVNANAINPKNPNRVIPNLVLGLEDGMPISIEESYVDKDLDVILWEICTKHEMSFEILMNHESKKYVFSPYLGDDRSAEQSINPHVIFSKAFDNVTLQTYVDDKANHRSMAYVAGEGEGVTSTMVKVNDEISGFARREIFIDANRFQSKYIDEDEKEVTLTPEEYKDLLKEHGYNGLGDYQRIRTFESDIDFNSQFIFNEDYYLGDKVTNRNDELEMVTHSRVATAKEVYNRQGYHLSLQFGTSVPKLTDKIKRMVK